MALSARIPQGGDSENDGGGIDGSSSTSLSSILHKEEREVGQECSSSSAVSSSTLAPSYSPLSSCCHSSSSLLSSSSHAPLSTLSSSSVFPSSSLSSSSSLTGLRSHLSSSSSLIPYTKTSSKSVDSTASPSFATTSVSCCSPSSSSSSLLLSFSPLHASEIRSISRESLQNHSTQIEPGPSVDERKTPLSKEEKALSSTRTPDQEKSSSFTLQRTNQSLRLQHDDGPALYVCTPPETSPLLGSKRRRRRGHSESSDTSGSDRGERNSRKKKARFSHHTLQGEEEDLLIIHRSPLCSSSSSLKDHQLPSSSSLSSSSSFLSQLPSTPSKDPLTRPCSSSASSSPSSSGVLSSRNDTGSCLAILSSSPSSSSFSGQFTSSDEPLLTSVEHKSSTVLVPSSSSSSSYRPLFSSQDRRKEKKESSFVRREELVKDDSSRKTSILLPLSSSSSSSSSSGSRQSTSVTWSTCTVCGAVVFLPFSSSSSYPSIRRSPSSRYLDKQRKKRSQREERKNTRRGYKRKSLRDQEKKTMRSAPEEERSDEIDESLRDEEDTANKNKTDNDRQGQEEEEEEKRRDRPLLRRKRCSDSSSAQSDSNSSSSNSDDDDQAADGDDEERNGKKDREVGLYSEKTTEEGENEERKIGTFKEERMKKKRRESFLKESEVSLSDDNDQRRRGRREVEEHEKEREMVKCSACRSRVYIQSFFDEVQQLACGFHSHLRSFTRSITEMRSSYLLSSSDKDTFNVQPCHTSYVSAKSSSFSSSLDRRLCNCELCTSFSPSSSLPISLYKTSLYRRYGLDSNGQFCPHRERDKKHFFLESFINHLERERERKEVEEEIGRGRKANDVCKFLKGRSLSCILKAANKTLDYLSHLLATSPSLFSGISIVSPSIHQHRREPLSQNNSSSSHHNKENRDSHDNHHRHEASRIDFYRPTTPGGEWRERSEEKQEERERKLTTRQHTFLDKDWNEKERNEEDRVSRKDLERGQEEHPWREKGDERSQSRDEDKENQNCVLYTEEAPDRCVSLQELRYMIEAVHLANEARIRHILECTSSSRSKGKDFSSDNSSHTQSFLVPSHKHERDRSSHASSTPLSPPSRAFLFFLPSKHSSITSSSLAGVSTSPSSSLPSSSSLFYPSSSPPPLLSSSSPPPLLSSSSSQSLVGCQQQPRHLSSFSCNSGREVSASASPLLLPPSSSPPLSFSHPSPSPLPPAVVVPSLNLSGTSVSTPRNTLPVSPSSLLPPQTLLRESQPRGSPRNLPLRRDRREEEEEEIQAPTVLPEERRKDEEDVSERTVSYLPQSSSVFSQRNPPSSDVSLYVQNGSSRKDSSVKKEKEDGGRIELSLPSLSKSSHLLLHREKPSPIELLSPRSHLRKLGLSEETLQMLQSSSSPSPRLPSTL